MTQNTNTVDYPHAETLADAKALVSKAVTTWRKYGKQGERVTATMAATTLEAMRTGYLADGRDKDRADGSITKGQYGSRFDVVGSQVSYWITLAHALRVGVKTDSALWGVLTGKRHVARNTKVSKGADGWAKQADIVAAMVAAGLNPDTGEKAGTNDPANPRNVDGKDTTGEGAHEEHETPVAPFDAAKAAIKALEVALQSPTIQSEEYDTIRGLINRVIAREDRRRGLGNTRTAKKAAATPATVAKKAAAKKAAATLAATGTDG